MRIDRDGDKLLITLESCCAIMYVEEHAALLKDTMAALATEGVRPARLTVDISDVEEMDTAYFQMLMVLRQHAGKSGWDFVVMGVSPCVSELQECFGVATKEKP